VRLVRPLTLVLLVELFRRRPEGQHLHLFGLSGTSGGYWINTFVEQFPGRASEFAGFVELDFPKRPKSHYAVKAAALVPEYAVSVALVFDVEPQASHTVRRGVVVPTRRIP